MHFLGIRKYEEKKNFNRRYIGITHISNGKYLNGQKLLGTILNIK